MGDIPTRREFVALTAVIFAVWGLGNIANYVPTLTLASTLYSQNTGIIMVYMHVVSLPLVIDNLVAMTIES